MGMGIELLKKWTVYAYRVDCALTVGEAIDR